jgi:hypothetical protein
VKANTFDRCLTVREFAARWRCRPDWVRDMIRGLHLAAIRFGGRARVLPEAIAAAEGGQLAVKPVMRRLSETVSEEVRRLLDC